MMNLDSLKIIRNNKAIEQLTMDGEVIQEWVSTAEASRKTKVNKGGIINCMKGRTDSAGGYRWRYK